MSKSPVKAPVLQSARLILQPLTIDDAEAVQRLFPHWEIVRHMADKVPWPYPDDGALVFIRDIALPRVLDGTAWFWTLRLKELPDQVIGMINVMLDSKEHGAGGRGFWIGTPWQRQGLMTEASNAVLDFWFNVLGQNVLRVSKSVNNDGSRGVSIKNGMRVVSEEHRNYVSGPAKTEIWQITKDEWQQRSRSF